jgi:nucleoporin NUP82
VSSSRGVFFISFESWIRELERELMEPQNEGLEFRLSRILESATTQAELCMPRPSKRIGNAEAATTEEVNSCVVLADGNLGYFVLTTVNDEPQAVILDAPEHGLPTEQELAEYMDVEIPTRQARPTYQPPRELYDPLQFITNRDTFVPSRHKAYSKEEMRLSSANLDILMNAHKALSKDTYKLQAAVSDLFIRCQRLREEFQDQISRVGNLVGKIDAVTGKDGDLPGVEAGKHGNAKIEERLEGVKKKQEAINARYESIRRRMANVGGTNLSEKEKAFVEELQTMDRSLDQSAQTLTDDPDGSDVPAWQRLDKVKGLQKELAKEAERASREGSEERAPSLVKVPSHSRKQEQQQIEALLQRESALVEAATDRLRALGISIL